MSPFSAFISIAHCRFVRSTPGVRFGATILIFAGAALIRMEAARAGDGDALAQADVPRLQVIERGEDFSVVRRVTQTVNPSGTVGLRTNEFTVLENALNYLENGVWLPSEDRLEPALGGAVSVRGPHKAIFSPDLNAEAVFDVLDSDGTRLRGGPRAVLLIDLSTGRNLVQAVVKDQAPGELISPDLIVYRDAFEGLRADVLYVWRHNVFRQDLVLRERPELPDGWDPATTRLEIATEFLGLTDPAIESRTIDAGQGLIMRDDHRISLPRRVFLEGKAFGAADAESVSLGAGALDPNGIPVAKQWHRTADDSAFLIESIGWAQVEPLFRDLPSAAQAARTSPAKARQTLLAGLRATRGSRRFDDQPMLWASRPYRAAGLVLDFEAPPASAPYTLQTGKTYLIQTNYFVHTTVTFEPGCVVKYNPSAYLLVYGTAVFPDSFQTPVFTAHSDDAFGDDIDGIPGTTPTQCANPAIWFYNNPTYPAYVRNARFRWAVTGLNFYNNQGTGVAHQVRDCLFEHSQTGIYRNLSTGSTIAISNSSKRNVTTPIGGSGAYSGSLADPPFYTDKQRFGLGSDDPLFYNVGVPEDPTGAVSATRLVQVGNNAIAAYDISDPGLSRIDYKLANQFFGAVSQSGDPRIIYDWQAGRWVATAIDLSTTGASLKFMISKTDDPTPLDTTAWDRYSLDVGMPGWHTDFPTLGYDSNAYYIAVHFFQPSADLPVRTKVKVIAIRKPLSQANVTAAVIAANATVLDPTASNPSITRYFVQPAINYDAVGPLDYAWFVAKGAPNSNPGGGARLTYFRLQWVSVTNYTLLDPLPWSNTVASMAGYFDGDGRSAFIAPQKHYNGANPWKDIYTHGSKLQCAVIRNGQLWTTHHVGINKTDGGYFGDMTRVGYWGLEEGSGTVANDASGASHHGALEQGVYWTSGRSGSMALNFDGSSGYVEVGAQAALVMNSALTMSAWIRPTASSGGVIVNKEGEYEMAVMDGTIQLAFANEAPGWDWINTGYSPPLNQWSHVAVTYQSGAIATYVNGSQVHSYPGSGDIGDVAAWMNTFRIGGREWAQQFFTGSIDDVQIWNRALSAGEISALANLLSLRSAVQILKAAIPLTPSTTVTAFRIYDNATATPYWYYYPSLDINPAGSVVTGFSGSKMTEYLGAFYWGRKADGTLSSGPILIHAGRANSHGVQWGHYSGTAADASGFFWTVQEYPDLPQGQNRIHTTITRIGLQ